MDDIQRLCSLIVAQAAGCEAWIETESEHPGAWLRECVARCDDLEDFLIRSTHAAFLRYRFFNGKSLWNITREPFEAFASRGDVEAWEESSGTHPDAERIRAWISQL